MSDEPRSTREELHSKIRGFLAGEFARQEGQQCIRVDLVYTPRGFREQVIGSWLRKDDPTLFDSHVRIEELASAVIDRAEAHADTFDSGKQRFTVNTYQHYSGRQVHVFVLLPAQGDNVEETGLAVQKSESGVIAGHAHALMRINEQMYKSSFGTLAGIAEDMRARISRLEIENDKLKHEVEEARSNKEEREFSIGLRASAEQRKARSWDTALQIGTVVATKMVGGGNEPGAPTPLSMLLAKLGESLRPEQIPALFAVLDVGQRVMFAEIMKMVMPAEKPVGPANGAAHP